MKRGVYFGGKKPKKPGPPPRPALWTQPQENRHLIPVCWTIQVNRAHYRVVRYERGRPIEVGLARNLEQAYHLVRIDKLLRRTNPYTYETRPVTTEMGNDY